MVVITIIAGGVFSFIGGNNTYLHMCANHINCMKTGSVLDIGVGRQLAYMPLLNKNEKINIIGCDVSEEEVQHNKDIDSFIICNASELLDLPDESIHLITSHMCIEHLENTENFIKECNRILVHGGTVILFFAGALSPHGILNKILPLKITRKLLYTLLPGTETTQGFPAYYDRTTYTAFSNLLLQYGFEIKGIKYSHGVRGYLMFFIPFYVLGLLIDCLRHMINLREFACGYIFVAHKKSEDPGI